MRTLVFEPPEFVFNDKRLCFLKRGGVTHIVAFSVFAQFMQRLKNEAMSNQELNLLPLLRVSCLRRGKLAAQLHHSSATLGAEPKLFTTWLLERFPAVEADVRKEIVLDVLLFGKGAVMFKWTHDRSAHFNAAVNGAASSRDRVEWLVG